MTADEGRVLPDLVKRCPECGRDVTVPGGYYSSTADALSAVQDAMADHGLRYVADHPSLVAMLDQAEAAHRDSDGPR